MKSYRFLAVAPSFAIARIIEEAVTARDNVEAQIHVGSLQRGREIVQEQMSEEYDAVLARGATAQMIKEICALPVIEIQISFYDILQAVKLAENFRENFAIVGFPAVTDNAMLLKDLLRTDWEIHTIYEEEEADGLLCRLKERGIRLIVSGMALDDYFKKYGLNYVQITTGSSSITQALEEAVKVSAVFRGIREERDFYRRLLEENDSELLLLKENGEVCLSNLKSVEEKYALGYAQRQIRGKYFQDGRIQKLHKSDKLSITQKKVYFGKKCYYAFYFYKTELPFLSQKNDVNIYTREAAARKFLQHQNKFAFHWRESEMEIRQIGESASPVVLIGEEGVGKGQLAASIYIENGKNDSQYYVIDFQHITDRYWNYLITSIDSPLNAKGWTIYFRDVNALTPNRIVTLKNMVEDTIPYTKNKCIFSCTTTSGSSLPSAVTTLINDLSCIVLHILPLRERKEELPSLSSIYMNSFNMEYGKQISGFTPEGMRKLQSYDWPGNLAQFKRILMQLVQSSASPYIQADAVEKLLSTEEHKEKSGLERLNLSKPLCELNYDIVRMVLEKCGGNQTQAAKQLGICRTTLWRMMNGR